MKQKREAESQDSNKRKRQDSESNINYKFKGKEHFFSTKIEEKKEKAQEEVDQEVDEDVEEKKIRLAKQYLEQLATLEDKGEEDDEENAEKEDLIGQILTDRALYSKSGKRYRQLNIADKIKGSPLTFDNLKIYHGQQLAVTSIALDEEEPFFYSASKDQTIVKWDINTLKKVHTWKGYPKNPDGHKGEILALAVSSDGLLLASGGKDKKIRIWDAKTFVLQETYTGHKDIISALAFHSGTHTLYSASYDRSVKLWNCDAHAYRETLYGHTSSISSIDALKKDRCITSGYDKSIRLWKIADQTQLVFSSGGGSIDCVTMIKDDLWASGSQDGSLALWSILKKKPVTVLKCAHGMNFSNPFWISAIASIPYSDVIATGSNSGVIKLWKVESRSINHIKDIPLVGWINALKFTNDGKYLIVGVGKDHRLGRWDFVKNAKNGVSVIPLLV